MADEKTTAVEMVIPIVAEEARIETRIRETGRVKVSTHVTEHVQRVEADLAHEDIEVVRVPMNVVVEFPPPVREENGVVIYSVVEERLFVDRRLVLCEEVRLTPKRRVEHVAQDVTVQRTEAVVERMGPDGTSRDGR